MGEYDDIIHLPHYRSAQRSHMSIHDRAAQFSPFAALTGFESVIMETGRQTDCRMELEEYEKTKLDQALAHLQMLLPLKPQITVTYFIPDSRKDGGAYVSVYGQVRKIDSYRQRIIMTDGNEIPLADIVQLECSQFPDLE